MQRSGGVPSSISSKGIKSGCSLKNVCSSSSLANPSSRGRTPVASCTRIFICLSPHSASSSNIRSLTPLLTADIQRKVDEDADTGKQEQCGARSLADRGQPAQQRYSANEGDQPAANRPGFRSARPR